MLRIVGRRATTSLPPTAAANPSRPLTRRGGRPLQGRPMAAVNIPQVDVKEASALKASKSSRQVLSASWRGAPTSTSHTRDFLFSFSAKAAPPTTLAALTWTLPTPEGKIAARFALCFRPLGLLLRATARRPRFRTLTSEPSRSLLQATQWGPSASRCTRNPLVALWCWFPRSSTTFRLVSPPPRPRASFSVAGLAAGP